MIFRKPEYSSLNVSFVLLLGFFFENKYTFQHKNILVSYKSPMALLNLRIKVGWYSEKCLEDWGSHLHIKQAGWSPLEALTTRNDLWLEASGPKL